MVLRESIDLAFKRLTRQRRKGCRFNTSRQVTCCYGSVECERYKRLILFPRAQ